MLASFAVWFNASVLILVLGPTARLSLRCCHCVATVSLLHSVALRKVQSDMYIATVTATNDVIDNPPQPLNGSHYNDEKKMEWRR